jgi:hypothetical protein
METTLLRDILLKMTPSDIMAFTDRQDQMDDPDITIDQFNETLDFIEELGQIAIGLQTQITRTFYFRAIHDLAVFGIDSADFVFKNIDTVDPSKNLAFNQQLVLGRLL